MARRHRRRPLQLSTISTSLVPAGKKEKRRPSMSGHRPDTLMNSLKRLLRKLKQLLRTKKPERVRRMPSKRAEGKPRSGDALEAAERLVGNSPEDLSNEVVGQPGHTLQATAAAAAAAVGFRDGSLRDGVQ